MNKTKPTPETQPKTRLHLSMREFSFFGKDKDAVITELKTILDSGHTLSLNMNQSTTLSDDLFTLDSQLVLPNFGYEMHMRFPKNNGKALVMVILQKEVIA
jgi:hypothetical protein